MAPRHDARQRSRGASRRVRAVRTAHDRNELDQLDEFVSLLAHDPSGDELLAFYRGAGTLRIPSGDADPYRCVARR